MGRFSVTVLLLAGLLIPAGVRSQEEEEELEMDLFFSPEETGRTVTSAARHAQERLMSPSAVTVITREQIENTHCADLTCLMRQVPEVDVMRVTPMWVTVGARALTTELGDKVLVIVDGREVNLEFFGLPFWGSLPVHLEDIERIEVIRGPGSALYGANAHSMVVSIFTRRSQADSADVYFGAGERDALGLHLRAGKRLGSWQFQASGGYEAHGHWRLNDVREAELSRLRLKVEHQGELGEWSLDAGVSSSDGRLFILVAPAWLKDSFQFDAAIRHKTSRLRWQLSYSFLQGALDLNLPLFFQNQWVGEVLQDFDLFGGDLGLEGEVIFKPWPGNLLVAGGNLRWVSFLSEQNRPQDNHQLRAGLFVQDEQQLGENLALTASLRLDYSNITPLAFSPRLAAVWRFAKNQSVRLAFARAFRRPAFLHTSLHLTNVGSLPGFTGIEDFFREAIGNEGLDNESVTVFEAGYQGNFLQERLQVEADVFFNLYRDTIHLVLDMAAGSLGTPDLNASVMQFRNTGMEANALGGSLVVTLRPTQSLRLDLNYTLRHSWYASTPDEGSFGGAGEAGERVAWEPGHLANLSLQYLPDDGPRLGIAWHGVSERDFQMNRQGDPFAEFVWVHNPAHSFLSGFVAWRVNMPRGWLEAGIRAYNLLHVGFYDFSSVTRRDGVESGGEWIGRKLLLYIRGKI